jgi:hypothetical protein
MRTAERAVRFCCGIFFLLFAAAIPAGPNPAVAQALPQPKLTRITVTISPLKATLFAGETQVFVATVLGGADKTVTWSVAEEEGGAVTNQGMYTAPKVQGIYHVTAASATDPQKQAVATLTVLAYCDPPAVLVRQ